MTIYLRVLWYVEGLAFLVFIPAEIQISLLMYRQVTGAGKMSFAYKLHLLKKIKISQIVSS